MRPDGDFLLFWDSSSDIWVRAFNKECVPLSDPQMAVLEGVHGQQDARLAACDQEGNYIVAWAVECVPVDSKECYYSFFLRRYDRLGNWLGQEFLAHPDHLPGEEEFLVGVVGLAAGPNGESVVLTGGTSPVNVHFNRVYAWLFDRDLTLRFPPILLTDDAHAPWWSHNVVGMDGGGNFVMAWQYPAGEWWNGQEPVMDYIRAQRFSRNGERIGEEIAVSGEAVKHANYHPPSVAMDSAGHFVVVWNWHTWGAMCAQRFDANGTKIGGIIQVNVQRPAVPSWAEGYVSMNDNGQIAVGYTVGFDPGERSIRARVFDLWEPSFLRGDANADGAVDLSDAIRILLHLFGHIPEVDNIDALDTTDNEAIDLSDVIYLLCHLFAGDPAGLPHPWPLSGFDPT
jgi:hypothetical protein